MKAEIERLQAWAKDEQQKREAVEEDRLRERQENERLRAALKPFVDQIEAIECTTDHNYADGDRWPVDDDQFVKIGDLRAARTAYQQEAERK